MDIRFHTDAESGLAHCYAQHGITEREVIAVLRRPAERFGKRRGEEALVADGRTDEGRYIRVIYREYPDRGYLFVITAYEMTGNAKRAFRRRRRP